MQDPVLILFLWFSSWQAFVNTDLY